MNRIVRVAIYLLMVAPAHAAESKLSGDEILNALREKSLYAGDNGAIEQIFQKGGQTVYIDHGSVSQGQWKIENDRYCSQWPPSKSWACYDVTRDGQMITFVTASGTRFPMRESK